MNMHQVIFPLPLGALNQKKNGMDGEKVSRGGEIIS